MLDLSHIPSQQQQTFTFYATGNWQTWNKPRNAKFIEIFCLGGGQGGSLTTVGVGAITGGGGGGSAGIVRGLIPAFLLPDTLYIQVGKGGEGSNVSGQQGTGGGISVVALLPYTIVGVPSAAQYQITICTSSGAGAGTGGATISTVAQSTFGNLGLFTAIAGVAASAGGASTPVVGGSQAALGTNLTTGGAGGGGKTAGAFAAGGNITAASAILTNQVSGGITSGQNGADGYGTLQPFCGTGGAGGAGRQGGTGAGGRGGNGWYGCGGGGAGGSSTATGTKGGDGGDGLVVITVIT